uniref:OVATE domain-containing protein n=1 Tax=Noccaea caerulescens TaxID=107243 RepID=A0A1J3JG05_NOCCA
MFQKTNSFFHRTLHSLKSIILRAGKKLPTPKTHFSCTFCRSNSLDDDNIYASFLNIWESDLENSTGGPLKLEQKAQEQEQDHQEKKTGACSSRSSRDCDTMEKKIKEMYMIETGDIEQALDVEEALHYYSLLRSPEYLNIVDKFFNDLYS